MSESQIVSAEEMHSKANLEPIGVDDLAEIIDESKDAFLAPASNPEQTTDELFAILNKDPAFQAYGYVVNGRPVSYIVALSHKDPTTISIGPMYVAESYQKKGLGLKQVEDFLARARGDGYEAVFTKTWLENRSSRRIFDSLGFVEDGIKPHDRSNGDSTIMYLRHL